MQALPTILASLLIPFAADIHTHPLSNTSNWTDAFGPIRADQFSFVIWSSFSVDTLQPSHPLGPQPIVWFNVTVNGQPSYVQTFNLCPLDGNQTIPDFASVHTEAAEPSTNALHIAGPVVVGIGNMCGDVFGGHAYNESVVVYDGSTFEPATSDSCELWTTIGGEVMKATDKKGAAIMRCLLEQAITSA